MKKFVLTLGVVLFAIMGFAQGGVEVGGQQDGPVIEIDKDLHDYGTVEYGADGTCVFTITNTGNAPLLITQCDGSCGCTVPSCPKVPVAPGATAKITVKYDTERSGPFHKSVTIKSNAVNDPVLVVKIKGAVKAKPTGGVKPAKG